MILDALIFFLFLFFILVVGALIVVVICFFGDFWGVVEHPLISFDSFLDFYAIAPGKWVLHSTSVTYSYWDECRHIEVDLRFNLIDSVRYKHWRAKQERKKETIREARERADLIRELQKDIDRYVQETREQLNGKWT